MSHSLTAILTLVVGLALFLTGVIGQIASRRARTARKPDFHPQDRQGARIVLVLAAIVIGGWMTIASAVTLLHAHAQSQRTTIQSAQ